MRNRDIEKRLKEDKMNFKSTHRLLLLGLWSAAEILVMLSKPDSSSL